MAVIRQLWSDPLVRSELNRGRWLLLAPLLAAVNSAYVLLFAAMRLQHGAGQEEGPGLMAEFRYPAWLLVGLLLLSLSAHWLVPPAVLRRLAHWELRLLNFMVRERRSGKDIARAQILGALLPLAAGAAPLFAGLLVLAFLGTSYLGISAAVLFGAALWAALCAGVSAWSGALARCWKRAALRTYFLTCVVLPVAISAVSVLLALGCSFNRTDAERVFTVAAGLTWAILVAGAAGVFWDLAASRLFAHRSRSLWQAEAREPAE
jgi:hypothetical protein